MASIKKSHSGGEWIKHTPGDRRPTRLAGHEYVRVLLKDGDIITGDIAAFQWSKIVGDRDREIVGWQLPEGLEAPKKLTSKQHSALMRALDKDLGPAPTKTSTPKASSVKPKILKTSTHEASSVKPKILKKSSAKGRDFTRRITFKGIHFYVDGSTPELVLVLKDYVATQGGVRNAADALRSSPAELYRMLNETRPVSERIAEKLGYLKVSHWMKGSI